MGTEIFGRTAGILFVLGCTMMQLANGFIFYRLFTRFAAVRNQWSRKLCLLLVFMLSNGMVIWVGDNNLILTFLCYVPVCLGCTEGSRYGRLAVIFSFFCMEMSVCALIDTYLGQAIRELRYANLVTALARTVVYGGVWLYLRKKLPEGKLELSDGIWKIIFGLSVMPLCSLLAVVSLTYEEFYHDGVRSFETPLSKLISLNLGIAVLPFAFLTSFVLLAAMVLLADYERLERAQQLAGMREEYYENMKRQEKQVRQLRHDMKNHLAAVQTLLAEGKEEQASGYLETLLQSAPFSGWGRFCAHETANAVLQAKAELLRQLGVDYEFRVEMPEEIRISDIDVCSLLGNALDNAAEAAEETAAGQVTVQCRCDKGMLMLQVSNNYAGEREEDLRTTKADKDRHGLGLAKMREIASGYGGYLNTDVRDGRFVLTACIPL